MGRQAHTLGCDLMSGAGPGLARNVRKTSQEHPGAQAGPEAADSRSGKSSGVIPESMFQDMAWAVRGPGKAGMGPPSLEGLVIDALACGLG